MRKMKLQGHTPKTPQYIELVGYTVTAAKRKICTLANNRLDKAMIATERATRAPMTKKRKKRATQAKTIPIATHGQIWTNPSLRKVSQMRSKAMTCYWGNTSKMRCTEIILAVLNDPTRIDQQYASLFRSFHDARRVTRKSRKRADKLKEDLRLQLKLEVPPGSTGPARGLLDACQALGINLSLRDNKVILQTPLGA